MDSASGRKINNYSAGNSPHPDQMCEK